MYRPLFDSLTSETTNCDTNCDTFEKDIKPQGIWRIHTENSKVI